MKLIRWLRFSWDLARLPAGPEIDSHYRIRPAERAEQETVRAVIHRAFTLDPEWANVLNQTLARIDSLLGGIFHHHDVTCLIATHGSRIIGTSPLLISDENEKHLLSGPCILIEYRNRGIGSALLHRSLAVLREAGLARANGVTKENTIAAKFIYPKFGSTSAAFEPESQAIESR